MIAFLSGTLQARRGNALVVNVNGVGYLVQVPSNLAMTIGQTGSPVELVIHTAVREDAITLYGFQNEDDLDFFNMVTTLQGVGPKMAL